MAQRFWVGGSGTWNATTTHWSAISGGSSGATAPSSSDDVIFDAASNATAYTVTLSGALTCKSLTVVAQPSGSGVLTVTGSGTLAIVETLTLFAGTLWTATGRITYSDTSGTVRTLTFAGVSMANAMTFDGVGGSWKSGDAYVSTSAGALTLTNGTFDSNGKAVTIPSFASNNSNVRTLIMSAGTWTLTGTGNVFDCTAITNMVITKGATVQCTDSSATARTINMGNSSTAHPTARLGNVAITAGTGTFTTTGLQCDSLDFTGFTGTWAKATKAFISGDLTLTAGMATSFTSTKSLSFDGTGTQNITPAGQSLDLSSGISLDGSGTYRLKGDFVTTGAITHNSGSFDLSLDNKNLTCASMPVGSLGVRTLKLGSGTITLTGTGTVWQRSQTNLTFDAGTSTVKLTDTSSAAKTFDGGGLTYHALWFTDGSGALTIQSSNTFDSFRADPGAVVDYTAGTTQTVTTTLTATGTAGNLVTLQSSIVRTRWNLTLGASAALDYATIADCNSVNESVASAGAHSVDGGNNLRWVFTRRDNALLVTGD